MSKPSKLTEKATRIPETRELQWNQVIPQYLQEVEPLHSESSRSHRFAALLQELLGLSEPGFIESYSSGIEKSLKVRQKDRILKGRADNLFGNLLIEFEANIPKTQKEAEEQLRRYTAILWSQEGDASRTPYICLATDGVRFIAYSPVLTETPSADIAPDDISLQVIESVDWTTLEPREVYYWLDRYFLRKELLRPSSEALVRDFGISSHALQMTELDLLSLWKQIKTHSAFNVVYDSWEKYLRIVYGSSIAGDELFIRHTYLATLAKLMAWMRITGKRSLPNEPEIVEILEGRVFKAQGIENFIEEDFFSWIAREDASETGIIVTRKLFSLLQNYNLSELSEDVLKSLYQELVDPETRHDLGEFYTPDWLAHRIVNKLLDEKPEGSFLDPACGSGTFLYLTIKEKRQRLGDSAKTLSHILESVKGADIHPLAIITAKTNYILALGELFRTARRGTVTIPIYLADTLRPPERWTKQALVDYEVSIEDQPVYLPEPLLQNPDLYDQAIELAKEYARQNKGKAITLEAFQNYLTAQGFAQSENELTTKIFAIAETLKHFIDIDRDTIWAFVLKNIFKPLFFKDSFDFIIGNPPWISFRYMDTDYQKFLRVQITKGYMLLRGRGELITHLEIATLFLVRAADLYLKSGGTVAFVLPRSIFTGDQHHDLRQRTFIFTENPLQNLFFKEVWDCEKVKPLFGVPSCVVIADKRATDKMAYPIPEESLGGRLDRKNASLEEAEKLLTINSAEISLNIAGKRSYWTTGEAMIAQEASCYKKRFMQGATIVPRSFWFVQTPPSPLGFNPGLPLLETSDHARKEAKADYKTVYLKGNVESRFLYATLLSADLLPFGHLDYRLVVLPIEPQGEHYKMVSAGEVRKRGFFNLAQWLETAENEWDQRRSEKSGNMTIYERLDRVHGLSNQKSQAKYRVLYNTAGTFLTAAVVKNEIIEIGTNGQSITTNGFAVDHKTYYYELNNEKEAFFLSSVLNAPIIDELVKPMQSRGDFGPRDIHKKVLEFPIPKFDEKNKAHQRLAEIGEQCAGKVETWLTGGGKGNVSSIGRLRGMVRNLLKDELAEIDELVKGILK